MTDDEIDAVLRPVLAKAWDCLAESVIIYGGDRLAYRAGMREAARIVSGCWCGNAAAIEIERASDEQTGDKK